MIVRSSKFFPRHFVQFPKDGNLPYVTEYVRFARKLRMEIHPGGPKVFSIPALAQIVLPKGNWSGFARSRLSRELLIVFYFSARAHTYAHTHTHHTHTHHTHTYTRTHIFSPGGRGGGDWCIHFSGNKIPSIGGLRELSSPVPTEGRKVLFPSKNCRNFLAYSLMP